MSVLWKKLFHALMQTLWPIGMAGPLIGLVIFAGQHKVYEACLQGLSLALMLYGWLVICFDKKEKV